MVANLTTPLIGIVSTIAIGRLGDATLLGGVAIASVIFDCLFWLFAFLRMSTVAFTAQALGAGETLELRAILLRGFAVAALVGAGLILLQLPLAAILLNAMGGSDGVRGVNGGYSLASRVVPCQRQSTVAVMAAMPCWAVIAAVIAEASGLLLGLAIARRLNVGQARIPRAALLDRAKLMRMLSVNRDIMLRTASLIAVFLFFTAQGARSGDVTLAANAVLNNFLLVSAFFLDGLANAAEQLCGRATGARDRDDFAGAVRLVISWGFGFALAVAAIFALFGPGLIAIMTANEAVRLGARDFLGFVVLSPLLAVFAFGFDGVYIGATWAREMRNLMMLSLLIFLAVWFLLRPFGNAGLWGALLAHYAARGGLQALRYPAMLRASFPKPALAAGS